MKLSKKAEAEFARMTKEYEELRPTLTDRDRKELDELASRGASVVLLLSQARMMKDNEYWG